MKDALVAAMLQRTLRAGGRTATKAASGKATDRKSSPVERTDAAPGRVPLTRSDVEARWGPSESCDANVVGYSTQRLLS